MSLENQMKFCLPQNISGVSQQNNVTVFFQTIEVDKDLL